MVVAEVARLVNDFMSEKKRNYNRKNFSHFVGSNVITPAFVQTPIVFTSGTMLYASFGTKPGYTNIASKSQTIWNKCRVRKKLLRTSPSGLKALAPVPVGLSTASDESSASTTCNVTDDPNRRFDPYITRGNDELNMLNILKYILT